MKSPTPFGDWGRPHFTPGGGDATVLYAVFGDFPQPLHLDAAAYRSAGLPIGVRLTAEDGGGTAGEPIYGGWLGQDLRTRDPDLYAAVARAPACLTLRGLVPDPPTLDYLRDIVGLLTALLEAGGVALLDWQALSWFSPARWRERVFEPAAPVPTHHVSILVSPEERPAPEETLWVHTRGMRKFGRPDISIHGVAREDRDGFFGLCSRLITGMALGGIVPDGQRVRVAGVAEELTCHHAGDPEDPDFNNVRLDVVWPDRGAK